MSVSASFQQIIKRYGDVTVIDKLDLDIHKGEFFTLLGPSGCGKTTLLRMVAGFNTIEGGDILIAGSPIQETPAYKRNMGMVFQNYAIFPHMSVFDNVAYGLKARRIPKEEIKVRVEKMLETMQIAHLADRQPKNLSGGQQQRVALARAIVIEPTMLLMDEPLSNLDAKLRVDMRVAIKDIQRKIGITTIYVTHDQEEALAISDRIAVMNKGLIQQVDSPLKIYQRPSNTFVATFIGHMNLLEATYNNKKLSLSHGVELDLALDETKVKNGDEIQVGVRPEEFLVESSSGIPCIVKTVTFLGRYVHYHLVLENGQVIEFTQDIALIDNFFKEEQKIFLKPDTKKINVFCKDGSNNLIPDSTK